MKKDKKPRSLKLKKLQIRDLTPSELEQVEGAATVGCINQNCASCTCPPKMEL